jgi:hypothetical protein
MQIQPTLEIRPCYRFNIIGHQRPCAAPLCAAARVTFGDGCCGIAPFFPPERSRLQPSRPGPSPGAAGLENFGDKVYALPEDLIAE